MLHPTLLCARELALLCALGLIVSTLPACSEDDGDEAGGGGGTGATAGNGFGGSAFNQCGVAAPLPAATGQCTALGAPAITDFDDYSGTAAGSYSYRVGAEPPVPGAILHVGDGSDMNGGSSVIATEMVTGADGTGYALQISNSNALNWGGLLMFYFPGSGATAGCLDARDYDGVEFSVKGSSPSGRFGVSLGMLDTIPLEDNGLCDNAPASDCKSATVELMLPADPETWTTVQLPWSAFTPGVGSALSCVPVTGQNIVQLVIQPFMNYPPPDFMFEPGAYTLAVDDVGFY